MLPILHLRRQAAANGWRLSSQRVEHGFRTLRWVSANPWDGGGAVYQTEISTSVSPDVAVFIPSRFAIDTQAGQVEITDVSADRLPAMLRAYLGWVDVEVTV